MNAARVRPTALLALLLVAGSGLAQADSPPPWSYSGGTGPAHWGEEDTAYATCANGQLQSPIDIEAAPREDLPAIQFDYRPVPLDVTDTGYTIQVNVPAGSGGIVVGGERYDLVQFHFHRPSEERVRGRRFALVAHLVHKNARGEIAVVAVLIQRVKGAQNPVLRQVFDNLPDGKGEKKVEGASIDLNALLPRSRGYYTFAGSLTIPPCSEGVRWFVLKRTLPAQSGQIAQFAARYPDNARPTQPLHGRSVAQTRN
ncbi:MAG: carbonic anhydrase family protein [Proteobacteria bacterium]|nr:carbonic anhydrase family protein [Pseudomonadota bacterium]